MAGKIVNKNGKPLTELYKFEKDENNDYKVDPFYTEGYGFRVNTWNRKNEEIAKDPLYKAISVFANSAYSMILGSEDSKPYDVFERWFVNFVSTYLRKKLGMNEEKTTHIIAELINQLNEQKGWFNLKLKNIRDSYVRLPQELTVALYKAVKHSINCLNKDSH